MNELKIIINTGNAAFQPDARPEIARILRKLAETIEDNDIPTWLWDISGNKVGKVEMK